MQGPARRCCLFLSALVALSQTPDERLPFEVASVKPAPPDARPYCNRTPSHSRRDPFLRVTSISRSPGLLILKAIPLFPKLLVPGTVKAVEIRTI